MSKRIKAFESPAPEGWIPVAGERVWINADVKPGMGGLVSTAVILIVTGGFALVGATYGHRYFKCSYGVEQLRPCGKPPLPKHLTNAWVRASMIAGRMP